MYTGRNGVWRHLLALNAGQYRLNLANDTAEDGGPLNDRIDGVHVCGPRPHAWHPNWP
jgi:hypothetical protein